MSLNILIVQNIYVYISFICLYILYIVFNIRKTVYYFVRKIARKILIFFSREKVRGLLG